MGVPSQGRKVGAVSSYCFLCSQVVLHHSQLELRDLVPFTPPQGLEVARSYPLGDSLQDLKVVINLVGSWLLGKSSLTTRDPHISNVGVGSFVGIRLDESKAAERSRRTTCATLLLPYPVDGTSLAPGLGVCSLFIALQQLTS